MPKRHKNLKHKTILVDRIKHFTIFGYAVLLHIYMYFTTNIRTVAKANSPRSRKKSHY